MSDIGQINSRHYSFFPNVNEAGEQILLQRISALESLLENRLSNAISLRDKALVEIEQQRKEIARLKKQIRKLNKQKHN